MIATNPDTPSPEVIAIFVHEVIVLYGFSIH
jgi:hypothetical protein